MNTTLKNLSQRQVTASQVLRELKQCADTSKAEFYPRFFKCSPGEYGEGDRFLGVTVPKSRKIAAAFKSLPLDEIKTLLDSKWHEARLTALIILVNKFKKADPTEQEQLYSFYCANLKSVNNWDLVDSSAPYIAGAYLYSQYVQSATKKKEVLGWFDTLATSKSLWDRRVAILSTFFFIRQEEFHPTLQIAERLLNDDEDLIHKAVGWMLREVGNRSISDEVTFLDRHYKKMPRTMLRYAIEKLPKKMRDKYMDRSK